MGNLEDKGVGEGEREREVERWGGKGRSRDGKFRRGNEVSKDDGWRRWASGMWVNAVTDVRRRIGEEVGRIMVRTWCMGWVGEKGEGRRLMIKAAGDGGLAAVA